MTGGNTSDRGASDRIYRLAQWAILPAIAMASFLSWRPFEMLFTVSDFLFCIGFVLLLAAGRLPLAPMQSLSGLWYLALGLLLAGFLVGSLVNGDPDRWVVVALQYCFAIMLLPMLLIGHDQPVLDRFAIALIFGVTAMEAFGIGVYYLYADSSWQELNRFGYNFISGGRRLGVFLGDGNWNGSVIAMTLPFLVHLMVQRVIGALPGFVSLGILVTGLVLAASVTGLVTALLGLLIYALVAGAWPSARAIAVIGIAVTAYVTAVGTMPTAFEQRIAPALQNESISQAGTFTGRYDLIKEAWKVVDGTTFVGLGVDQYRVISYQEAPVHNMYLLAWAEGGIWSLIGWLALLVVLLIAGLSAVPHNRRAAGLALSVIAVLMVAANASPHMYARMWTAPVFLALGFALAAAPRRAGHAGYPAAMPS